MWAAVAVVATAFPACDASRPAWLKSSFGLCIALVYAPWLAATGVRTAGVTVWAVGGRRKDGSRGDKEA